MSVCRTVNRGRVSCAYMRNSTVCAVVLLALSLVAAAAAGSVAGPVESGVVPGAAHLGVTYDCHHSDKRTSVGREKSFFLKSKSVELAKQRDSGEIDETRYSECIRELEEKYKMTKDEEFEPMSTIHAHTLSTGGQVAFNFMKHPEGGRRFVVHFHGNAQDVGRGIEGLMAKIAGMTKAHVIAVDFPGYGQSSGDATKGNIDEAMKEFLTWVSEQIGGAQNLLVTAWSIGTGAPNLFCVDGGRSSDGLFIGISTTAIKNSGLEPAGVVLMAPYSAAHAVVSHVVAKSASSSIAGAVVGAVQSSSWWNTVEAVKAFQSPVFIAHGLNDATCPYSMGEEVCKAAGERCTFVTNPDNASDHYIDFGTMAKCRELYHWVWHDLRGWTDEEAADSQSERAIGSLLSGKCRCDGGELCWKDGWVDGIPRGDYLFHFRLTCSGAAKISKSSF